MIRLVQAIRNKLLECISKAEYGEYKERRRNKGERKRLYMRDEGGEEELWKSDKE